MPLCLSLVSPSGCAKAFELAYHRHSGRYPFWGVGKGGRPTAQLAVTGKIYCFSVDDAGLNEREEHLLRLIAGVKPWIAALLIPINGCLVSTHKLQRLEMPSHVMTATADQLIGSVNERCEAIQSLAANADFQIIEGGPKKGKQTTSSSFSGTILERKPASLRVTVRLPVLGTTAVDMATEGQAFTLMVPIRSEAYVGPNSLTTESQNSLENMRPNVFSDSLLLGCIPESDLVTLTSETKTLLDPKAKHLIAQADYDLVQLHRKGSRELTTQRVIHFNRTDLIPYQVDIYDENGSIQTEATYGPMESFDQIRFPDTITIKRPLDELEIRITIEKLKVNLPLPDDKFELTIPAGTTVHRLK